MERISIDHRVMGGVPCIAGTRIPVATVVGLLAHGQTIDEILDDYPTLIREDIFAALELAAKAVNEREDRLENPAPAVMNPPIGWPSGRLDPV